MGRAESPSRKHKQYVPSLGEVYSFHQFAKIRLHSMASKCMIVLAERTYGYISSSIGHIYFTRLPKSDCKAQRMGQLG